MTSKKTDWVRLDPSVINKPQKVTIGNMTSEFAFQSPLDVPEAVRADFDETLNKYIVEFKYLMGDEPHVNFNSRNGIVFVAGKNSGKIYKIELVLPKSGKTIPNINAFIDTDLDQMTQTQATMPSTIGNYRVAREAFRFAPTPTRMGFPDVSQMVS